MERRKIERLTQALNRFPPVEREKLRQRVSRHALFYGQEQAISTWLPLLERDHSSPVQLGSVVYRQKDALPHDCIAFQSLGDGKGWRVEKCCLLSLGTSAKQTPCQGRGQACVWKESGSCRDAGVTTPGSGLTASLF